MGQKSWVLQPINHERHRARGRGKTIYIKRLTGHTNQLQQVDVVQRDCSKNI